MDHHSAVWLPLSAELDELRLQIVSRGVCPVDEPSRVRWARLAENNPRLFDGPILSFRRLEGETIEAGVETYMRLITRQPGVCHLAVTGVLERDGSVLLGLRSQESGVHPGVWEFVPSGGMEVPLVDSLTGDAFLAQLIDELNEEVAGWSVSSPRLMGLVIDPVVPSCDLVIRVNARPNADADTRSWEHHELLWVAVGDLAAFAASKPCIPTVVPIMAALLGEV